MATNFYLDDQSNLTSPADADFLAVWDADVLDGDTSKATVKYTTFTQLDSRWQSQGAVLDDLNTLGANSADGEFLVGTGAGALAWESGATVRTSLGLDSAAESAATDFVAVTGDAMTGALTISSPDATGTPALSVTQVDESEPALEVTIDSTAKDINIIRVDEGSVAGSRPLVSWDESENLFNISHGMSFGSSPAQTGYLRMPTGTSFNFRNVQDTGDYIGFGINASNHIEYANRTVVMWPFGGTTTMLVGNNDGKVGIGNGTSTPNAKLLIKQGSTTLAQPVLSLQQADVDEDFLRFIGTSDTNVDRALVDAADFTTPGSIVGWLKIYVQDDQSSGPITDGDYYIPFYSAPSA